MNLTQAQQRSLRAHLTHLAIALRLPYKAETLSATYNLVLAKDHEDPEASAEWLDGLHPSSFPRSTALTPPSTDLKPERN